MKIDLNTSLKNNKHENSLTKTMKFKVIVHQLNTYYVESDTADNAEQWVKENELWIGRDQDNEYESYLESEEVEE